MAEYAGLEVKFDVFVLSEGGGFESPSDHRIFSLQANVGMSPFLTHELFLPNPLQFTTHPMTSLYDICSFNIYLSYGIKFTPMTTEDRLMLCLRAAV
jgi:hypothetical protein